MAGTHAGLGASGYHRWSECPASYYLSRGVSSPESVWSIRGSAQHTVAEAILSGSGAMPAAAFVGRVVDVELDAGGTSPVEITEEMARGIQLHVDTVMAIPALDRWIEQRVDVEHIAPGMFGTCDAAVLDMQGTLHVVDLKTGHSPVDPDSPQLQYYALGAVRLVGREAVRRVSLTIVQPARVPAVSTAVVSLAELDDFARDLAAAVARVQVSSAADTVPGSWCKYCPVASTCPGLRRAADRLTQGDDGEETAPSDLSSAELGARLTRAVAVEAWIEAVRDLATSRARAGDPPTGWLLASRASPRKWRDQPMLDRALAEALGEGADNLPLVETDVISPAKLEKLVGRERMKLVDGLLAEAREATYLARDDGKRKAAKPNRADYSDVQL